jgi:hypothetical protein
MAVEEDAQADQPLSADAVEAAENLRTLLKGGLHEPEDFSRFGDAIGLALLEGALSHHVVQAFASTHRNVLKAKEIECKYGRLNKLTGKRSIQFYPRDVEATARPAKRSSRAK